MTEQESKNYLIKLTEVLLEDMDTLEKYINKLVETIDLQDPVDRYGNNR